MTPKEALARIEDRELSPKEIEDLLAFAEDIRARLAVSPKALERELGS